MVVSYAKLRVAVFGYAKRGRLLCEAGVDGPKGCRLVRIHNRTCLCHDEMVTYRDIPDAVRKMRVASVAEWRAAGLTQPQLRSLARSGELIRVWHGVYATRSAVEWGKTGPARGHALLAIAVQVAVGRDSVASHQSAALIQGLDLFPAAPNMVILTRSKARRCARDKSDGMFLHAAELPEGHVTSALAGCVSPPAEVGMFRFLCHTPAGAG